MKKIYISSMLIIFTIIMIVIVNQNKAKADINTMSYYASIGYPIAYYDSAIASGYDINNAQVLMINNVPKIVTIAKAKKVSSSAVKKMYLAGYRLTIKGFGLEINIGQENNDGYNHGMIKNIEESRNEGGVEYNYALKIIDFNEVMSRFLNKYHNNQTYFNYISGIINGSYTVDIIMNAYMSQATRPNSSSAWTPHGYISWDATDGGAYGVGALYNDINTYINSCRFSRESCQNYFGVYMNYQSYNALYMKYFNVSLLSGEQYYNEIDNCYYIRKNSLMNIRTEAYSIVNSSYYYPDMFEYKWIYENDSNTPNVAWAFHRENYAYDIKYEGLPSFSNLFPYQSAGRCYYTTDTVGNFISPYVYGNGLVQDYNIYFAAEEGRKGYFNVQASVHYNENDDQGSVIKNTGFYETSAWYCCDGTAPRLSIDKSGIIAKSTATITVGADDYIYAYNAGMSQAYVTVVNNTTGNVIYNNLQLDNTYLASNRYMRATKTLDLRSDSCIGNLTVTLSATDLVGNTSSSSYNISIFDSEPNINLKCDFNNSYTDLYGDIYVKKGSDFKLSTTGYTRNQDNSPYFVNKNTLKWEYEDGSYSTMTGYSLLKPSRISDPEYSLYNSSAEKVFPSLFTINNWNSRVYQYNEKQHDIFPHIANYWRRGVYSDEGEFQTNQNTYQQWIGTNPNYIPITDTNHYDIRVPSGYVMEIWKYDKNKNILGWLSYENISKQVKFDDNVKYIQLGIRYSDRRLLDPTISNITNILNNDFIIATTNESEQSDTGNSLYTEYTGKINLDNGKKGKFYSEVYLYENIYDLFPQTANQWQRGVFSDEGIFLTNQSSYQQWIGTNPNYTAITNNSVPYNINIPSGYVMEIWEFDADKNVLGYLSYENISTQISFDNNVKYLQFAIRYSDRRTLDPTVSNITEIINKGFSVAATINNSSTRPQLKYVSSSGWVSSPTIICDGEGPKIIVNDGEEISEEYMISPGVDTRGKDINLLLKVTDELSGVSSIHMKIENITTGTTISDENITDIAETILAGRITSKMTYLPSIKTNIEDNIGVLKFIINATDKVGNSTELVFYYDNTDKIKIYPNITKCSTNEVDSFKDPFTLHSYGILRIIPEGYTKTIKVEFPDSIAPLDEAGNKLNTQIVTYEYPNISYKNLGIIFNFMVVDDGTDEKTAEINITATRGNYIKNTQAYIPIDNNYIMNNFKTRIRSNFFNDY